MAYVYPQPLQTHGYQTSVDLAKRHDYSTVNVAGVKRNHQSFSENVSAKHDEHLSAQITHRPAPPALQAPRLKASVISSTSTAGRTVAGGPSEDTQRKCAASTPGPSQNPLLSLAHPRYGLPDTLVSNLTSLGVRANYPWQSSCLLGKGVLTGEQNLVYTAPTGGGKSLVADVLLLKKVIEQPNKKAILVLPYIALVQENLKWFRRVVESVSKNVETTEDESTANNSWSRWRSMQTAIRIAGFFGGSRAKATWTDIDIAVCTIEKANVLVNAAVEEGKIDQLGVVVLDELHMLDDENRGYLMELMITKLLCLQHGIQLVGMSATLSNPRLVADWLKAKFYVSKVSSSPNRRTSCLRKQYMPYSKCKGVLPDCQSAQHRFVDAGTFDCIAHD